MYLDFVHGDSSRSKIAIEQMQELYQRNPKMLIRLGSFAADLGEYEMAKAMWRNSIKQHFLGTNDVVQRADQYDQIEIADVLPDTPEVARQVAAFLIQYGDIRKELLATAFERLHCETCQSNSEQAYCERLAGDVAYALEKYDESFEHYQTALQLTPTDNRMHKNFIRKLREQGMQDEALRAAQIARHIFPNDRTFTGAIQKMAADDLKRLESKP
jgi:tetratricopeptide (TPR) repeat protein